MPIVPGQAPAGYVRRAPEWTLKVLRCRFTMEAPTSDPPSSAWFSTLAAFRHEAGNRFIADMARQGWELKSRLIGTNEPVASRVIPNGRAQEVVPLAQAYEWDFEIAGRFIRKLMPMEILNVRPKNASRIDLYGYDNYRPLLPEQ